MEIDFDLKDAEALWKEYPDEERKKDDKLENLLFSAIDRGYLTRNDLVAVARWKYPGGSLRNLVLENTNREIREIIKVSCEARTERLRIGALMALRGVSWPMASVILHFASRYNYPVLDVRTMYAVKGSTNYNLARWMEYTALCRAKAREFKIDLRVLDRALWVYGGKIRNKKAGKRRK